MKSLIFVFLLIFIFISCDNDKAEPKTDIDEISDEVADEINDETADEVADEINDEISDETNDEAADDDIVSECKDLSVEYSNENLDTDAKNIILSVYSNGWGNLLDTLTMQSEGNKVIEVDEENPYNGETPSYFIYETSEGFFTNYTYAEYGDNISVNLDPIMKNYVNGNIFIVQDYFGPSSLFADVTVYDKDGKKVGCFSTNGKFVIDIPIGDYIFSFTDSDGSQYDEPVSIDSNYIDIRVSAMAQDYKPNIYLYPEEKMDISLSLEFPQGGFVTKSIPEYGDGWNVTVEPDGTINGEYGYLFYEAQHPDFYQYKTGWTVKKDNLEKFFRENLARYGFKGKEVEDFIEWWIPRLNESCYDIYPQTADEIDKLIKINISKTPDSVQRLFYVIKKDDTCRDFLAKPEIKSFERKGFSLLEWGVVLK